MSRFFVGQRVRILWSNGWPELRGQCGTVLQIGDWNTVQGARVNYFVVPDTWGSQRAPTPGIFGGHYFGATSDQLEPLTDPGREVIAWADCVWKPDHLRSRVEVGP